MSEPKRVPVLLSKFYRSPGNGEFLPGMVAGFPEEEAQSMVAKGIAVPYLTPEEALQKAAMEAEEAASLQRLKDLANREREEAAALEERKKQEAAALAAASTTPSPVAHADSPSLEEPMEAISITMSGEGTAHPPAEESATTPKKKKGKA